MEKEDQDDEECIPYSENEFSITEFYNNQLIP